MAKIATFYDHMVDIARQESLSVVEALKLAREMGIEAVEASGNNIVGREDEFARKSIWRTWAFPPFPPSSTSTRTKTWKSRPRPFWRPLNFWGRTGLLVIPGFWRREIPLRSGGKDPADDPLRGPAGGAGPPLWGFPGDGGL